MTDPTTAPARLSVPVSERDHTRGGPPDAPVTIVTYGDYECPYTRKAQQVLGDIQREHGDRIRLAYRHFPLNKIHPHARQAAEAAEGAAAQGDFWGMHDLLFANQRHLGVDDLVGYAAELGLDGDRLRRDLDEGAHLQRVRDDARSGVGSGVASTPNIFINGVLRAERFQVNELPSDIDALLRRLS
jgi:formate-nitrite transporter family protein